MNVNKLKHSTATRQAFQTKTRAHQNDKWCVCIVLSLSLSLSLNTYRRRHIHTKIAQHYKAKKEAKSHNKTTLNHQ